MFFQVACFSSLCPALAIYHCSLLKFIGHCSFITMPFSMETWNEMARRADELDQMRAGFFKKDNTRWFIRDEQAALEFDEMVFFALPLEQLDCNGPDNSTRVQVSFNSSSFRWMTQGQWMRYRCSYPGNCEVTTRMHQPPSKRVRTMESDPEITASCMKDPSNPETSLAD